MKYASIFAFVATLLVLGCSNALSIDLDLHLPEAPHPVGSSVEHNNVLLLASWSEVEEQKKFPPKVSIEIAKVPEEKVPVEEPNSALANKLHSLMETVHSHIPSLNVNKNEAAAVPPSVDVVPELQHPHQIEMTPRPPELKPAVNVRPLPPAPAQSGNKRPPPPSPQATLPTQNQPAPVKKERPPPPQPSAVRQPVAAWLQGLNERDTV